MTAYVWRLLACAGASAIAHVAFAGGMSRLPGQPAPERPRSVTVQLVAPPPPEPPPEPPKPDRPPERAPERVIHEKPQRTRKPLPTEAAPSVAKLSPTPPTERPATTGETTGEPVFAISMESTSQAGRGPAVRTGNTLQGTPDPRPARSSDKPLPPPAAAYEVTKMPLPKGRCEGRYTDAAIAAAIEGTVVLELVVGEDGRPRDVKVIEGLGHGLSEAAVAALKACRFTPGERSGVRVPVRIPRFKITFVLPSSQ